MAPSREHARYRPPQKRDYRGTRINQSRQIDTEMAAIQRIAGQFVLLLQLFEFEHLMRWADRGRWKFLIEILHQTYAAGARNMHKEQRFARDVSNHCRPDLV